MRGIWEIPKSEWLHDEAVILQGQNMQNTGINA
jgi:hypothetical protein